MLTSRLDTIHARRSLVSQWYVSGENVAFVHVWMTSLLPALSFFKLYVRKSWSCNTRAKWYEDLCRMLTAKGNSPLSGPFGDELRILVVLVYSLPVVFNSLSWILWYAPDSLSAPAIIFYTRLLCSFLTGVGSARASQVLCKYNHKSVSNRAVCIQWLFLQNSFYSLLHDSEHRASMNGLITDYRLFFLSTISHIFLVHSYSSFQASSFVRSHHRTRS